MGRITRTNFGLTRTTKVTNAQIIALPTMAVPVIPAKPNFCITPVLIALEFIWTADYTNIDANAACSFFVGDPANGNTIVGEAHENVGTQVSGTFAPGKSVITWFTQGIQIDAPASTLTYSIPLPGYVPSQMKGQPLNFALINGVSGNLTGGNAANTMWITVFYNMIQLRG
jgi:hypothetical protein